MASGVTWPTIMVSLYLTEMGSRYFFIVMYVWLEKYFSRGDYRRDEPLPPVTATTSSIQWSDTEPTNDDLRKPVP